MPQKEPDGDGPSLELPSFGLGRKRKQKKSAHPPEPVSEDVPPPEPEPESESEPEPVSEDVPPPQPEPELETHPVAEPEPEPETHPVAEPEPEPEPVSTPEPEPEPVREPATAGAPLFTDERPSQPPSTTSSPEVTEPAEPQPEGQPARRRGIPLPSLPAVAGPTAAMITGAVVGLLMVGATWASLRLCELVQGTSSCGNPGFFLLLAIAILMVLLGQLLLTAFGVSDAGSTSFLGVGLVGVVALLFLVDLLFSWWTVLVVPVVAIGAFALSHWVTVTFVEIDPGDSMHR